jgi:hypothetical protein
MERRVFPSINIDACNTIAKIGICTCTHEWHEEIKELHFYILFALKSFWKKTHLKLNRICNINWWFSSHQALGISDISGYNQQSFSIAHLVVLPQQVKFLNLVTMALLKSALACTHCVRCWDRHWCDECNHFITVNNTYTCTLQSTKYFLVNKLHY